MCNNYNSFSSVFDDCQIMCNKHRNFVCVNTDIVEQSREIGYYLLNSSECNGGIKRITNTDNNSGTNSTFALALGLGVGLGPGGILVIFYLIFLIITRCSKHKNKPSTLTQLSNLNNVSTVSSVGTVASM